MLRSIRRREHAAQRLDAERQRRHVEQQHVLDVALQHAGLDRGADGDDFVRIDALMRLLAEEVASPASCTFGMRVMPPTSTTSLISPAREPGILQRLAARLDGLLDQVVDQRFEFGAGQLQRQMFRAARIGGDVGQVDLGLRSPRTVRSWPFPPLPSGAAGRACPCAGRCRSPCLNSSARYSTRRLSKSSPPRKVSPLVDFTSKTPSPISRIETSKVPPPRS